MRRPLACALLLVGLLSGACQAGGAGPARTTAPTTSVAASPTGAARTPAPETGEELVRRASDALASLRSYRQETRTEAVAGDVTMVSTTIVTADRSDRDAPRYLVRQTAPGGAQTEVITIGTTAYHRQPDGRYRRSTLDARGAAMPAIVGLERWAAAPAAVEVGRETVDGTQTVHYRLLVPATTQVPAETTVDCWVDAAFVPRRWTVQLTLNGSPSVTTGLLTDLDAPVAVAAPDPSLVVG